MDCGILFPLEIIVPLKILTFSFFGELEMYVNESHDIVKFLHTPMVPKKQLAFYDESSYHTNSIFSTSIRPNVVCAFVVEFVLSFYNGSTSASII